MKPVPVVLTGVKPLVVMVVEDVLEDEELAEEELAEEALEDEELDDDALASILLVEVEALMGPIELEALEDEVVVPAPIGPTLLLKVVVDTCDVLAPIGPTLAEGVEVVLALIWPAEEELEAYQSSHTWLLA
jgi:hypothetical protein